MTGALPIRQGVAVFLAISAYDWLSEGRADPGFALAVAFAAAASLLLYRQLKGS